MNHFARLCKNLLQQAEQFLPGEERKKSLTLLADYISNQILTGQVPRVVFICTHNSRRSHFGQVLAQALAAHLHIRLETYSGGTEATAFFPRAVETLRNAGISIEKIHEGNNPQYRIKTGDVETLAFSKVFSDPPNPVKDFAAVMVCSSADAGCPFVPGATVRISLPFEDPKAADGLPHEETAYRETLLLMGKELAWAFQKAVPA